MPQELVSLLIIIATIIFFFKLESKSIYWLPLYCVIIDGCYIFFQDYKYIHYTRSIFFTFLFLYIIRNKRRKDDFGIFLFLGFQLFVLFFYSTDIYYNLKLIHLSSVSLFMLPIGFLFFKTRSQLKILNKCLYWVVVFWAVYVVFSTMFKLGEVSPEKFGTFIYFGGFANTGGLSSIAFVLLILPFFIEDINKKSQKFLLLICTSFILITLLIALKRMSLIVIIMGYLLFFFRSPIKNKFRFVALTMVIAGILLGLSSYYIDKVSQRIDERGEWRFQRDFYMREARYIESIQITENILKFKSFSTSLFGNGYGSQIIYIEGDDFERDIHVTFNFYLQVSGIIGLLIYLNIYYRSFSLFRSYKKRIYETKDTKILSIIFINLLVLFLLAHFAGGVHLVTFRTIVFLYLGAILGVMKKAGQHPEIEDDFLLLNRKS